MAQPPKRKKPWLKKILIAVLAIVVILAGVYWYVATEKFSDTKDREAAYTLNALDFIREFQQNANAANEKYSDKIITLNGRVSQIESADTTLNIKFIDPATASYAIFAFQQQHLAEARTIKVGDSISIKGSCSGGIYSTILDATAITFKRSTLNK
jgi:type II secretory pathway pseudopilin PulG